MQADREDRYKNDKTSSRHSTQTLITAIAVIILAGAAYLLAPKDSEDENTDAAPEPAAEETTTIISAPRPEPEAVIVAAPDIPEQTVPDTAEEDIEEPVVDAAEDVVAVAEAQAPAPPTPEEIDAELREGVSEAQIVLSSSLENAYSAPYLLDRGISSIDQMARGFVPARSLNLSRPKGDFKVSRDGLKRFVDPAGYQRYDALVNAISALPPDRIAELFHRFRPQLTEAYAALGYPADVMDNTVIAALDQIISAPVRRDTLELRDKGALYAYADESLESASDLHKQLLRSGPDNTERLQKWAQDLRAELLR